MPCNFNDYASETLFWDTMNFKVYHPTTINYSWYYLPGGKIINWDSSQNYTVQNPDNFSYKINQIQVCKRYSISGKAYTKELHNGSCTTGYFIDVIRNFSLNGYSNSFFGATKISDRWRKNSSFCSGARLFTSWTYFCTIRRATFSNCSNYSNTEYQSSINFNHQGNIDPPPIELSFIPLDGIYDYQLEINDGGVISIRNINDPATVNVITLPSNNKEININGNKFLLLDESTIDLVCTDPIYERCPPWTIECECDGQLCCYQPTDYGWRLAKTINLN